MVYTATGVCCLTKSPQRRDNVLLKQVFENWKNNPKRGVRKMDPILLKKTIVKLYKSKSDECIFVFTRHPTDSDTRPIIFAFDVGLTLDDGLAWLSYNDGEVEGKILVHEILCIGVIINTFKKSKKGLNRQFGEFFANRFNKGMKKSFQEMKKPETKVNNGEKVLGRVKIRG
jgi:hypothetical protein